MKILVTGGNGFIGRYLVKSLVEDGNTIDVVDNLCNSKLGGSLWEYIDHPKTTLYIQSVKDFQPIHKYDQIFHLASPVGPAGILKYAGKMGPMIVEDTAKIAHMALSMQASMIDISTSEVYGKDPEDIPQKEDIDKIVPANTTVRLEYGVAKLACEVFLQNLVKTTSLQLNIIRPFNIVGVGQKGEVGFVLPRFTQQALSNIPLTVFGDGTQQRTFTSVKDLVNAIHLIMSSPKRGKIYNVGNPANLCSIEELAQKVIRLSASTSTIEYVDPTTIYGPLYREAWNKIPNIERISALNWRPEYSLEAIIEETINYERL